jgi:hypothetical protein
LIAVIGGSSATPEEAALAEGVGQALAQAGALLICGGRGGVMEAACRGAQKAGGLTIGVLPGGDRSEANRYVEIAIATGIGYARNAIIVRTADGVIAVGGSYGTLSEIGLALAYDKPLVGLGTWDVARKGHAEVPIARAGTAEDAVRMILARVRRRG